jgi:hypothetical protein
MRRYYYLLFLILWSKCSIAQLTGLLELGLGMHEDELIQDYGAAIGHTFNDNKTFGFAGVKMQKYPIVPPYEIRGSELEYVGETTDIYNFSLFAGGRYSMTLINFGEKASFERLGFFPECRLYLSPLLPYKLTYCNENDIRKKVKGEKRSQLAYSWGGGIFIGSKNEAYLALKFEVSTIDLTESLRRIDYGEAKANFEKEPQYLISVSFYLR